MRVLISGGSGLVGQEISKLLIEKGHEVAWLSRSPTKVPPNVKGFFWDPDKGEIDLASLHYAEGLINLAGASIAERWTPHYKNTILRSRVDGTRLLFDAVLKSAQKPKVLVSASAVGYYSNGVKHILREEDGPGSDFLSLICTKWEQEAINFEKLNIRTVRLRIGIVLDAKEGALAQMAAPAKWGFGAALGTGQQWMPWIHRTDMARMFIHALEDSAVKTGVYNASGPESVTNLELTRVLAKVIKRPLILPNVPAFALKLFLGEMAAIALADTKVSSAKIQGTVFKYKFSLLEAAVRDLYLN